MSSTRRTVVRSVTVAVVVVAAVAFVVFQEVIQPDEPSSFYDPPASFPDGPPGTVIRDQAVASDDPDVRAWRLLHTSMGPDGDPIAVSAVVVAPAGPPPAGGWPIVAWAHGTTGVASRCAPSLDADGGMARIPGLDQLVTTGHVVVATDSVGLGTPGSAPVPRRGERRARRARQHPRRRRVPRR
jgi:hypothetical protein